MTGRIVFDTNIIIGLVKGNAAFIRCFQEHAGDECYLSVITKMELLSYHGLSSKEEAQILDILDSVTVLPLNNLVEDVAVRFRRSTRRKLPDSIVAASAIYVGAVLVTNDKELANTSYSGLDATTP